MNDRKASFISEFIGFFLASIFSEAFSRRVSPIGLVSSWGFGCWGFILRHGKHKLAVWGSQGPVGRTFDQGKTGASGYSLPPSSPECTAVAYMAPSRLRCQKEQSAALHTQSWPLPLGTLQLGSSLLLWCISPFPHFRFSALHSLTKWQPPSFSSGSVFWVTPSEDTFCETA